MSSAVANPAFVPIAAAFHITPVQASYELAVYVSILFPQSLPSKPSFASLRPLHGNSYKVDHLLRVRTSPHCPFCQRVREEACILVRKPSLGRVQYCGSELRDMERNYVRTFDSVSTHPGRRIE